MLYFESCLSNTADDGDDGDDGDDDNLGFLLCLATSRATLGGSLVLEFRHWWYSSRLLRHVGEHSGSILLIPKPQGGGWSHVSRLKTVNVQETTTFLKCGYIMKLICLSSSRQKVESGVICFVFNASSTEHNSPSVLDMLE